jgi:hypothetical protein
MLDNLWWLKSQKFWALITGIVALVASAVQVDPFPYADFTMKFVALLVGFMASKAWEDGKKAEALAVNWNSKPSSVNVNNPASVEVNLPSQAAGEAADKV